MKIDRCIKNFMEKYDQEAIEALEEFSGEIGMNANYKVHAFNITEAFDTFSQSIEVFRGWANKSLPGADKTTLDQITENAHSIIDNKTFTECDINYRDLPGFVKSYLDGVKTLTEKVNTTKSEMLFEDASFEVANKLDEFCDHFIESLDSKFFPIIENAVKGSGYYSRKNLHKPVKKAPVFL